MPISATTPTPQLGEVETLVVASRVVACDGGTGPLGHPRVWLRIPDRQIFCPYCSRVYLLDPLAQESGNSGH